MSWVFADIGATELTDLLAFITSFAASPLGQIPKTERPPALQERLVVKLPPIA